MTARILVSATQSGAGKTTISLSLCRALARRGLVVQPVKSGPDFLDPTYLSIAAGRPCHNLDTWMMGSDYVATQMADVASIADIAIVEGVMGLFDGAGPDDLSGSSAEIAKVTKTPVVLVINAHGMAASIAAIVKGFSELEDDVTVCGVIANRVGSAGHTKILKEALAARNLPPLLGAIPRDAFPSLPSRHLGLTTATEDMLPESLLDDIADTLEAHVDLDHLMEVATAATTEAATRSGKPSVSDRFRLGIAKDDAFHFYYQDTLHALEAAGFDLVPFSPLKDAALPDVDALYIGGGYPEVHAAALEANLPLREAIRIAAEDGLPIYAECGGLMYLGSRLKNLLGETFSMCDVFDFSTRMLEKRKMLGYMEVELAASTLIGKKGARIRGHEFHYSERVEKTDVATAYTVTRRRTGETRTGGLTKKNVLASYIHLHLASHPEAIRHFFEFCNARKTA